MNKCENSKNCGLKYTREVEPSKWIEGNPKSKVWIVGLNPKKPSKPPKRKEIEGYTQKQLKDYFKKEKKEIHPYFYDFETVSKNLFATLQKGKAAHLDIVKCWSDKFPPKGNGANIKKIINNCQGFFISQLKKYKPKVIICNGREVCNRMMDIVKPCEIFNEQEDTAYIGKFNGNKIRVILSGYIGRIDNYAKKRLGKEIEPYLKKYEKDN